MTDRELLENAAKAAGYDCRWEADGDFINLEDGLPWNPLTDDGDAFRLMVELRLEVIPIEGGGVDVVRWVNGVESIHISESDIDEYAATRLAITRAAAEIGKGMK